MGVIRGQRRPAVNPGRTVSHIAIVHFVNYKRGTQSRAAMRGVMLYVMQEKKTAWEGAPLVSGINCQPQSVYDDFLNTKLLYHTDFTPAG